MAVEAVVSAGLILDSNSIHMHKGFPGKDEVLDKIHKTVASACMYCPYVHITCHVTGENTTDGSVFYRGNRFAYVTEVDKCCYIRATQTCSKMHSSLCENV